ncbi:alpha/beta fold hydrolase [Aureimonas endophytica]|nr:alpha/beta hydrolase [Aureimonas endophytica]
MPLARRLGTRFTLLCVDWPGFGTHAKPALAWTPEAQAAFLRHLLDAVAPQPFATLAAGHGAATLLTVAAERDAGRLCLLAPTWRGPLPTMLGSRAALFERIAALAEHPILGPLLYRANVNRPMIRMMVGGHVFEDRAGLTPEWLAAKAEVVNARGARHASLRFVTGALDAFADRAEFLAAASRLRAPILCLYGDRTPRRSKAEMAALGALPGVRTLVLPRGKLGLHEEYPDLVADAIRRFLDEGSDQTA